MNKHQTSANQLFADMHEHISLLLREIPILSRVIKASGDKDFEQLKKLPGRHIEIKGRPVIIMALAGPSGAGKSTIFNLLTSLSTPAGGDVRPITFASTVAVPEQIFEEFTSFEIFPGFNLTRLNSSGDLRNRNTPATTLFTAPYKQPETDFWLCVVDIPDFNTTETSNWEKAEQMIERADSIIFTVYTEAYKDQAAYEFLKRCCTLSGNLAYLLTKIDSETPKNSAQAVREDLLDFAEKDPDFSKTRANQVAILDYLRSVPFFYSERSRSPTLNEIKPLKNTDTDFSGFIFSQEGLRTVLSHYLQSIKLGIEKCNKICKDADLVCLGLQEKQQNANTHISKATEKIVGEEFPVFYILQMIKKLLEENRPSWIRRLISPVALFGSGLKSLIGSIHSRISSLKKKEIVQAVSERDKLERERLIEESEKLVNIWRETMHEQKLDSDECRARLAELQQVSLPAVNEEWELFVREQLENWINNNKDRWIWLNVINDLSIFVGTGLVVADIFIDGGMGTLGVVAAIGGGGAFAGFLSSLFTNLGLGMEINQANKKWKELRRHSYQSFITEKLARPLFYKELEDKLEKLSAKRISECRDSCRELKEISQRHES
jgi:energy-coupling factor transporter ATP-binding protein EcfA2